MSTLYTKEGEQKYSQKAVAGARYAVVQPSEGNRMAVMMVDENGFAEWSHFGGPSRTRKAIAEARSFVSRTNI